MDWVALLLSVKLSAITVLCLLPIGIILGRLLAYRQFHGKNLLLSCLTIPLILPPTVLGYYLLIGLSQQSWSGQILERIIGHSLAFSFEGLLVASLIFNLPFAIQPMQRGFEMIPANIRDAAACCGMQPWQILWRIELPMAWPGIVSAMILTFAHTLGEFGVVLMVGGNIPDQTQTIAIAIYDRVQAFDNDSARVMSAALLIFSLFTISCAYFITDKKRYRHD